MKNTMRAMCLVAAVAAAMLAGCATRTSASPGPASSAAVSGGPIERSTGIARSNGIDIAYKIVGPADGPPLLIIIGLGGQMSDEPDALTESFASAGFRTISFDNRDAGRSTHMDAAGAPDFAAIGEAMKAGKPVPVAYTLADMAKDSVGLLDALGIEKAHVLGGSMGGMIAQLVAANYPERVLSLTSLVSSSGNPEIPLGPAVAEMGIGDTLTGEARIAQKVKLFLLLGGTSFPQTEAELRKQIAAEEARASCGVCVARQSVATIPDSDRRAKLKTIKAPTAVISGTDDPIFPIAHGQDTAANIPGAQFWAIPGMGHLLPDPLVPVIVAIVGANAARSHSAR